MPELGEGEQGARVVLAQRVAQRVELALARPDEVLVDLREDLDGAEQLAVGSHRPMVLAVGAHEVGEHPGIAAVGLGPARRVPLPIARRPASGLMA